MADVIITLKVMPEAPDTDLKKIKEKAAQLIAKYDAKLAKDEIHPVAFGLNALHLTFFMNEDKGSTDDLEEQISQVPGVQSVMVIEVSRALG